MYPNTDLNSLYDSQKHNLTIKKKTRDEQEDDLDPNGNHKYIFITNEKVYYLFY